MPVPERQTELDFFLQTPKPIGLNNPNFTAELLLGGDGYHCLPEPVTPCKQMQQAL